MYQEVITAMQGLKADSKLNMMYYDLEATLD